MENLQNELGLPHQASHSICHLCPGNRTTHRWTDFRPESPWRASLYTDAQIRQFAWSNHILFRIPGCSVWCVSLDSMHIMDLGCICHAVGNLFFEMVTEGATNAPMREQKCNELWSKVQEVYAELDISHDNRIGFLTLSKFCNEKSPFPSYPCMTGFKARAIRYLVPVCCKLASQCEPTVHNQHRLMMFKKLQEACNLIDKHQHFMPQDDQKTFRSSLDAFVLHYSFLAKEAERLQKKQYSLVPKFHYVVHLPDQARFLSPKATRLYGSEDMVGRIAKLAHACLAGTAPHKVPKTLMQKYRLAMHLALNYEME